MYESLLKKAFSLIELDPIRHTFFFDNWEEVSFNRGEFITEQGSIEKYFYLVIQGVQAIYVLDQKGQEKVIGFSFDGSFSGIYDSFLKETGAAYFLKAITPSRLIRVHKNTYEQWFTRFPEFDKWGRIAHQEILIGRVKREVELITLTAQERFEQFMKRCPKELLEIPQKLLASYLNMTPETFSRMRSRIS